MYDFQLRKPNSQQRIFAVQLDLQGQHRLVHKPHVRVNQVTVMGQHGGF